MDNEEPKESSDEPLDPTLEASADQPASEEDQELSETEADTVAAETSEDTSDPAAEQEPEDVETVASDEAAAVESAESTESDEAATIESTESNESEDAAVAEQPGAEAGLGLDIGSEAAAAESPIDMSMPQTIRGKIDRFGVAMGTGRRKTWHSPWWSATSAEACPVT